MCFESISLCVALDHSVEGFFIIFFFFFSKDFCRSNLLNSRNFATMQISMQTHSSCSGLNFTPRSSLGLPLLYSVSIRTLEQKATTSSEALARYWLTVDVTGGRQNVQNTGKTSKLSGLQRKILKIPGLFGEFSYGLNAALKENKIKLSKTVEKDLV